jgi:hypothetical protein
LILYPLLYLVMGDKVDFFLALITNQQPDDVTVLYFRIYCLKLKHIIATDFFYFDKIQYKVVPNMLY